MLEELFKLEELVHERRLEELIKKYGLLDKAQYGFCSDKGTDIPLMITPQLLEHSRISRTDLIIIYEDMHHAFDAVDPVVGKQLAAERMGVLQPAGCRRFCEPRLPGVRLLVLPAAFPKPMPRGLPTARQTHAHFHLLSLALYYSLYGG